VLSHLISSTSIFDTDWKHLVSSGGPLEIRRRTAGWTALQIALPYSA